METTITRECPNCKAPPEKLEVVDGPKDTLLYIWCGECQWYFYPHGKTFTESDVIESFNVDHQTKRGWEE